jgi:hypothetical protein
MLVKTSWPTRNLMCCFANHRLGAQIERFLGAIIGNINCHHHRHTNHHPHNEQNALRWTAANMLPHYAQKSG